MSEMGMSGTRAEPGIGEVFGIGYDERIPLILVLDTSGSMGRPAAQPRIGQLVGSVERLLRTLRDQPALATRVDIAVITFGSRERVRTDLWPDHPTDAVFVPVNAVRLPELTAGGRSAMLPAVGRALKIGNERRAELGRQGIPCLRPVIWLITDGAPTNEDGELQDLAQCARLAEELRAAENAGNCLFFAIGVADADNELLALLAPRGTYVVDSLDYPEILHLITTSSQEVRSASTVEDTMDRVHDLAETARRIRRLEGEVG